MYIPLTFEGALQKCLIASSSYQGTYISGGIQYGYHIFTGSANLEVYNGSLLAQVIVVGGGGGGGSTNRASGGGGGGQVSYTALQPFYGGTYNISIGGGGTGATQYTSATAGGITYISGPSVSLAAVGGNGSGGSTGGSSGGGFSGGTGCTNVSGNGGCGGGGGGSTAAAANANCAQPTDATAGGAGYNISIANYDWSFGCGGGGGSSVSSGRGASCYGGYGAGDTGGPNTGNGGGGNWLFGGYATGGTGGSGVVIIQYPIETYCTNFFNTTGSCDCREITFDITDTLNYYPEKTGSYLYTQCGTNTFVSGTLQAYYPKTVCAASGSWFWVTGSSGYGNSTNTVSSSYPECLSASYGVQTCVTQSFTPICNSSIYTFSNSGSGDSTIYWVPKNSGNVSYSSLGGGAVTYQCVSNSTIGSIGSYPYGGSARLYTSASCLYTELTASWSGVGNAQSFATITFMQCNGTMTTLSVERGATSGTTLRYITGMCVDKTVAITTGYGGLPQAGRTVNSGSSCLGNYIDTGSCGCP